MSKWICHLRQVDFFRLGIYTASEKLFVITVMRSKQDIYASPYLASFRVLLRLSILLHISLCTESLISWSKVRKRKFSPAMTSLPIGEGDDAIVRGSNTQSKPEQSLAFNPKRYPELFGEGSLGDIMSDGSQHSKRDALLVTSEGGSLATRFGVVSRLDRMALTANGNLQRLFSSYYDAPVHVVVDKCQQKTPEMWERQVHLKVFDQVSLGFLGHEPLGAMVAYSVFLNFRSFAPPSHSSPYMTQSVKPWCRQERLD